MYSKNNYFDETIKENELDCDDIDDRDYASFVFGFFLVSCCVDGLYSQDFGEGILQLFRLYLQDEVDKTDRLAMKKTVEEKNIPSLEDSVVNDATLFV